MTAGELADLVRPIVEVEGFELVDCSVSRLQRGHSFRVFIDRTGGVPVAVCAEVSRRISGELDASPILQGNYSIEVSSPGMNRPVWTLEHFQRFRGERVRVELARPAEEPRVLYGDIGDIEDDGFWLQVEGGERRLVRMAEIELARLRMDPWKGQRGREDRSKARGRRRGKSAAGSRKHGR